MRALTIKIGEPIYIGPAVKVVLMGTSKQEARFGFSAPGHIPVHREEIYQQIQTQKETEITPLIRPQYVGLYGMNRRKARKLSK